MTVAMNVALPMQMFTHLDEATIERLVMLKLGLVGMEHAAERLPSELSGGMRKRAGLARALALDPDILFFDEPSAGLDPITSSRLDDLILNLRDGLGATIVIVSHELPSLFPSPTTASFLMRRPERRLRTAPPPRCGTPAATRKWWHSCGANTAPPRLATQNEFSG